MSNCCVIIISRTRHELQMDRSFLEAYLELGRTECPAPGAVETTGAVRLTPTFNHTNMLPGGVRRLGDILGQTFRRLLRKHARAALMPFGFSSPIKVGGQKSAVGKLFLKIRAAQRSAGAHSGKTSFSCVQLWSWRFLIRVGKASNHMTCACWSRQCKKRLHRNAHQSENWMIISFNTPKFPQSLKYVL